MLVGLRRAFAGRILANARATHGLISIKFHGKPIMTQFDEDTQARIYPPVDKRHIVLEGIADKKVAIIGDVHGCLDELLELLEKCAADHLIFVGDMINKGPKNTETLAYIRSLKNATFIRGNHEDAVLQAHFMRKHDQSYKSYFSWVDSLSSEDVRWLVGLPFTISLPEHNAIVVHAGLVPKKPLEQQQPHHMTTMRNIITEGGELVATAKEVEGSTAWAQLWPGPQHVYFGHDAKRGLQLAKHATGLDSGCVYGKRLTARLLPSDELVSVEARAVYVQPGERHGL